MRAKPDQMTTGTPPRRGSRSLTLAVVAGAAVGGLLTTLIVVGWVLRPDNPGTPQAAIPSPTASVGTSAPTTTTSTRPSIAAPSTFAGDDSRSHHDTRPPAVAATTASRFADAWRLDAEPANRRRALEPVASRYLVHSLGRELSDELPEGRQVGQPRLLAGSGTHGKYLIRFSTGETIHVTVHLSGQRWVATRIDPATPKPAPGVRSAPSTPAAR